MLKLQFKDQRQPPFWVVEKLYSIGSAQDNHLVLSEEDIAPLQARLIATANKTFLKDNNSDSGCFVNGQRITQKEILPGDQIRLGSVELDVLAPGDADHPGGSHSQDPWRLVSDGSWLAGQSYIIPRDKTTVLGRSSSCDIVIPGSHLSRQHVELKIQGGSLHIKDLDSANGTYLNDRPITEALAHGGDQLRIDVYSFRVVNPDSDRERTRLRATATVNHPPPPRPAKTTSSPPKRWKTRPTSPGNRQEPTYRQRRQERWLWLVVAAAATLLIGAFYWV